MANMVYCTMQVEAPDHKQLMEFISNQTDTNAADVVMERKFKLFLNDNDIPVSGNFSFGNNNNITIQFQTKWRPPSEEIKAIAKKYKNLIFKLEACEEFNDFIYEFNSDPNNYFETFRKLSTDEIEKLEENNINIGNLIEKLATLDDRKLQNVLEEVEEYKAMRLHLENKHDYIKENIKSLNDTQINSIYNILKSPVKKSEPRVSLSVEGDLEEDWI
jgi:hypothetical protein